MQTEILLKGVNKNIFDQLVYAAYFVEENITDIQIQEDRLIIQYEEGVQKEKLHQDISKLIQRFSQHEYVFKENIYFENNIQTPYQSHILQELLQKKIMKQLDLGVFTFREPFSTLVRFFDDQIVRKIANPFQAKHEAYPSVIHVKALDKTNHFTSFPEHIQFVTHLREDLDVIESFTNQVKEFGGWSDNLKLNMAESAAQPTYSMNPATCYHCYEGLQDETLDKDGIIVTAVSKCHRYESKNHSEFGRLLDFTMREIIFVGKPDFVIENRKASIELLKKLVQDWELDCHLENANDPFFTNDFQVKASFQRQQEMKYELRMMIPYLNKTISVSSSNFHGNTFGKAFNISTGKRPVVTGCLAFGLERFVLAFLSQYGLDESKWPKKVLQDFQEWKKRYEL
ncbi:aminoacyl--tRNA ligase-related protein [Bacillus thuringiensis]|uniref:aminoacyl--tRNA ligase-related protein n=1 Tax=Bacillus thuringiensis TaxID=1428 RepID=UPI000BFB56E4|nr:aminoacyl--tRNA ligase-related protein [Bacillus thuringiensis]PGK36018.1 hypothetical protein CN908_23310 [Bacillus thuringiensis]WIG15505.1 hypothetical protein QOM09_28020 [Bacillus thuringiensis]